MSVTQLPSTTQELTTSQEVPVTQETLTIQEVLATQKPSVTQKPSETDIPMATEIPYYLLRPGNPEPTEQPTVTDESTSQNKPGPTVPPYQSGAYDDMNEGLPMPGGLVMFPGYTIESIVPKTADTSVVRMVGNTDSLMYISTKYLEIECNNSKLSDLQVGDSVMIGCNIN